MKKAGIARRLRKTADADFARDFMDTVVCGKCGQRFAIDNDFNATDAQVAQKQAAWVEDQLVWDHIQERRHQGTMKLPEFQAV